MFCLRIKLMACGKECGRFSSLPHHWAGETLGQCARHLAWAPREKGGPSREVPAKWDDGCHVEPFPSLSGHTSPSLCPAVSPLRPGGRRLCFPHPESPSSQMDFWVELELPFESWATPS